MAEGGQHKTIFLRIEDTEGEKRDTFSSVMEQLDLGKLKALSKHPENTSDTWEDGLGALSSLVSKRSLSDAAF